jgi:hypothetical protein
MEGEEEHVGKHSEYSEEGVEAIVDGTSIDETADDSLDFG